MNDSEKIERIKRAIEIEENDHSYPPTCIWCEIRMTQHIVEDLDCEEYLEIWCDKCGRKNWSCNFYDFIKEVIDND